MGEAKRRTLAGAVPQGAERRAHRGGVFEIPDAAVPCGSCTLCCRHEKILVTEVHGDDVGSYRTVSGYDPLTGREAQFLEQRADGSCVYLGASGCTIHGRAPLVCRAFDCRVEARSPVNLAAKVHIQGLTLEQFLAAEERMDVAPLPRHKEKAARMATYEGSANPAVRMNLFRELAKAGVRPGMT